MQDFGAGLSVDELIGMTAWHIAHLKLPPGKVFETVLAAAERLITHELDSGLLMELWEDGNTVWAHPENSQPIVVSAAGQIHRAKD